MFSIVLCFHKRVQNSTRISAPGRTKIKIFIFGWLLKKYSQKLKIYNSWYHYTSLLIKWDRNLWKMLHIDYPSQIWNPMRDENFNTIEKKILLKHFCKIANVTICDITMQTKVCSYCFSKHSTPLCCSSKLFSLWAFNLSFRKNMLMINWFTLTQVISVVIFLPESECLSNKTYGYFCKYF